MHFLRNVASCNLRKAFYAHAYKTRLRNYSHAAPDYIRNIGIIAHIDAGKTTTTERMLYYSGAIKRMGNVDSGNTVTDFLPSERARGITVQSAAVTFDWEDASINVIDTPGHVDFTVEVERSLHVLDGAVAVLDASRGVEAQTRTVWRQADNLKIPRLAFINKMDKSTASFAASVISMQQVLSAEVYVIQIPFFENSRFCGIIDLINLTLTKWQIDEETNKFNGKFCCTSLASENAELWNDSLMHRQRLIEKIADVEDDVAELYLSKHSNDVSKFPNSSIIASLSNIVKHHSGVPVLCGSAVNEIGIHSLLDSVVKYLPSPHEIKQDFLQAYQEKMIGYAFKVVHHKRHGPVVFARMYSGQMKSGGAVFNSSKQSRENISQLFTVFADEYNPVESVSEGEIVAITGLKHTGTGDTLFNESSTSSKKLSPVTIPQPVFFCTIEADSLVENKALNRSLGIITREDPSIRVRKDIETGQTILCGMGELHMEVVTDRLRKEFKINCYIGPLQVAYREHPTRSVKNMFSYQRSILHKEHKFKMELILEPLSPESKLKIHTAKIRKSHEMRMAIEDGIAQACHSGVLMGFPLIGAHIIVNKFEMTTNSPMSVVSAAAVHMTRDLLKEVNCCVLEPIMDVDIVTSSEKLPLVLKSLGQRRATILEITSQSADRFVSAKAPVAEMLGYTSSLRSIASGNADLTLKVDGYKVIEDADLEQMKNKLSGHS